MGGIRRDPAAMDVDRGKRIGYSWLS